MLTKIDELKIIRYFAHPSADISESAKIGRGTSIWQNVQIRERAVIGENCNIGKSVYIDENTFIGNNVKIQNHVSVYKGVVIEDDVILAPNCTFTNDLYPRAFNEEWKVTPTLVERGASIGANSTILCGSTIGKYTMIGIGSTVTGDTLPYSLMVGNPARLKNFVCQCGSELKKIEKEDFSVRFKCLNCYKILKLKFDLGVTEND